MSLVPPDYLLRDLRSWQFAAENARRAAEVERLRRAREVVARYRRGCEEDLARKRTREAQLAIAAYTVESWRARFVAYGDVCTDSRPDGGEVRTYFSPFPHSLVHERGEDRKRRPLGSGRIPVLLDHDEEVLLGFATIAQDDIGLVAHLDLAEPVPPGWRGLSGGFATWVSARVAEHVEDGRVVEATIAEVSLVPKPAFPQSRLYRRVLRPRALAVARSMLRAGA